MSHILNLIPECFAVPRFQPTLYLLVSLVCLISTMGSAETDEGKQRALYESRQSQLECILQVEIPSDSLVYYLQQEAQHFAEQSLYTVAIDLLDEALRMVTPHINSGGASLLPSNQVWVRSIPDQTLEDPWQLSAEFGTDYSRNEYELSYVESDSVILDELNNPYVTLRIGRNKYFQNRILRLSSHNRIDQTLVQSSLSLSIEAADFKTTWRLEGNTSLFWLLKDSLGTSWSNELQIYWSQYVTSRNRLYLSSRLRYKRYLPSRDFYQNLLTGDGNISLRHNFHVLSWLEISVLPSHYQEQPVAGLEYSQLQSRLNFQYRREYNQSVSFSINHYIRYFTSQQFSEAYQNQYQAWRPVLESEWIIIKPFGLKGEAEWENRAFTHPDLTYSDFNFGSFSLQMKWYWGSYNSLGLGYVREYETHSTGNPAQQNIVNQENFTADGVIASLDLFNISGLLFTLSYQITRRNYPDAVAQDFLRIYSNRHIQTIQGIGYVPLSSHWQFQFYINFDADRDRDHDHNDNFSSLFNLSLQYKF